MSGGGTWAHVEVGAASKAVCKLGGRVSRRSPQRIAIGTPIQCAISIKGVNGKGQWKGNKDLRKKIIFFLTEAKVSGLGKVFCPEFKLLNLQATLKDFHCLVTTDGAVARNLFVTTDGKGSDSVPCLGEDWLLACELLKHLCCSGKPVTRLADADVDAELFKPQLLHRVHLNFCFSHIEDWGEGRGGGGGDEVFCCEFECARQEQGGAEGIVGVRAAGMPAHSDTNTQVFQYTCTHSKVCARVPEWY